MGKVQVWLSCYPTRSGTEDEAVRQMVIVIRFARVMIGKASPENLSFSSSAHLPPSGTRQVLVYVEM